jgi:DNA helicase HerA-like ATPase
MPAALGHVMTVTGAAMTASIEVDPDTLGAAIRIGGLVKVPSQGAEVIGTVSSFEIEPGDPPKRVLNADLLGELALEADGERRFRRGVSRHPVSGAEVLPASDEDMLAIYSRPDSMHVRIGSLYHDPDQAAFVLTDELLAKHFAVLGTTGSGKSCAVALILRAIIAAHPNAHVVLLDPHDEYAAAFRDRAEVVTIDNLQLPFWLLNHEEAVEALVRGGTPEEQQSQAAILKEAITLARRKYAGETTAAPWITVDTPVPFRVGDLVQLLDEAMGRLDKADSSAPYLRLKTRIESLNSDRRFAFMFSRVVTRDSLALVIGRLLRIPVNGRPITIIDLSGVPSEIIDVVVSLLCRLTFDFALWADRERMPPVLMVCEEAHRYVPSDAHVGFAATTRSIARIAKEGRKYGVSLGLVTQRPSELSTSVLAQCGTLFALRMGNETDQRFVGNVLPEAAHGMIEALPGMRPQEAIIVGDGVAIPMRIRFDDLPPGQRPRSKSAEFSKAWQSDTAGPDFIEDGIKRWRMQMRRQTS